MLRFLPKTGIHFSGKRSGFRVLVLGALLWGAPARAEPSGLEQVMAQFAAVPSSRAHFTERKFLSLLTTPLESSGTLSYVRPDRLERTTLYPAPERLSVRGKEVTVEGQGATRTLSLGDVPEVAALIESIRATLSGDLATLRTYYDVAFEGTAAKWELVLTPKETRMKALVRSIHIAGRDARIHTVDTEEEGGDRTIMTIVEDAR